jgi:hypothetical protein
LIKEGDRKMPVCEKIDSFKGLPIIVPYGTPQDEIDRFLKSGFEVIIGKKPEEDKNDNDKG